MAFNRRPEDDDFAEDLLAEEEAADLEDDDDGEDLLGANMMDDYQDRPELDEYDPAMLDDGDHEPLTIEQRRAAERAMEERDALEAGRSPSPGGSQGSEERAAKRRRMPRVPEFEEAPSEGNLDEEEDEVPESYYDLTHEKLGDGVAVESRVEQKVRRNFQQFLLRFTPEGHNEPRYPAEIRKMAEEHRLHLDVDYRHLLAWSAPLALWVAEHPVGILPILNETLMTEAARRFGTFKIMKDQGEEELRVAIYAFPIREPIRELKIRHLNKLVCLNGVVTKRSNVFNQVKKLYLRCAKCGFPSGPFMVAEEKDLKPGSCVECQSRGPWRVDRQMTLYRNFQRVTLQETPSSVDPGKMPRSKDVILTGDLVDKIRPGDELNLTGIYRCLYDAATNARTCFPVYKTEILAVHAQRKGDVQTEHITDEVAAQILELSRQPGIRERVIASMAPSIYGMWHVKTALALSMMGGQPKERAGKHRIRGDINTLIVGDPGLAKSQFLKFVEQTFPRAVYTTGKGASAVGLTAAVTRDEHGEWCLEGGAMVLADDGICLIDEFDKMNDKDRTSIHEAMEQQSISISKAGIVATLQARCAVIAVANPVEGRYDAQRTFSQNINLSDPILSRFDVLCVLRDESDPIRDEQLAEHVICSHIRSHPEATAEEKLVQPRLQMRASHIEPLDQELLQKYIVYARKHVHPKLQEIDYEKLASFYQEIRAEAFRTGGAPMTARHIDSMVRLAEANARLELRPNVTSKDVDNAIAIVLESFIQSQKHQVAEELRQKFRRYIHQVRPVTDQVQEMLDQLLKDKIQNLRLASPSEPVPATTAVPLSLAEIVAFIERVGGDFTMEAVHNFMRSPRFHQCYRIDGEQIFRIG